VVTEECNLWIRPGITNILISNSSGLDTALIAFLNATVPVAVLDEQSHPCVFPATIALPVLTTLFGLYPSKPLWNGTKNFLDDNVPVNATAALADSSRQSPK
jgi:hypothetical protein